MKKSTFPNLPFPLLAVALFACFLLQCNSPTKQRANISVAFDVSYYKIALNQDIPHGSDILGKPCSVVFDYGNGSYDGPYAGTIVAWPTQNTVLMTSNYMNLENVWQRTQNGVLSIFVNDGVPLTYQIQNFQNVTADEAADFLVTTFDDVNTYIKNGLIPELNDLLYAWQSNRLAPGYFNRTSGWFYEGTIRAQIATHIQNYIKNDIGGWLVLSEQPYPGISDQRVDIWIVSPNDQTIAIEVKADFILGSAENDYNKLLTANPREFNVGYAIFCADADVAERWQRQVQIKPGEEVYARAISRFPSGN